MARIASYLLHPFIMPLLGVIVLLNYVNWMGMLPNDKAYQIYLVTVISGFVIPWIFMFIFKATKIITGYMMPEAEERKIPLLLVSFMNLLGAFVLQKIHAPLVFPLFINCVSVVILICALISWRWKISYHMAAVSSLAGLILGISLKWMMDFRLLFAASILISGIVAWARLKNNDHSPAQVYAGFGLGFTLVFLIVRFI